MGFAAVPLYLFASTQLSRPMAAVLAIAYLFFPPLHGPNFYDFHLLDADAVLSLLAVLRHRHAAQGVDRRP